MPGRNAASKATPKRTPKAKAKAPALQQPKPKRTKTTTERVDRPDPVSGEMKRDVCLVTPPDREPTPAPNPKMAAYWNKVLRKRKEPEPDAVDSSTATASSSAWQVPVPSNVPGPHVSDAAGAAPSATNADANAETLLPPDAAAETQLPATVMVAAVDPAKNADVQLAAPSTGANASHGKTDTNINDETETMLDALTEGEMLAALEEALNVPCGDHDSHDDGLASGLCCRLATRLIRE